MLPHLHAHWCCRRIGNLKQEVLKEGFGSLAQKRQQLDAQAASVCCNAQLLFDGKCSSTFCHREGKKYSSFKSSRSDEAEDNLRWGGAPVNALPDHCVCVVSHQA